MSHHPNSPAEVERRLDQLEALERRLLALEQRRPRRRRASLRAYSIETRRRLIRLEAQYDDTREQLAEADRIARTSERQHGARLAELESFARCHPAGPEPLHWVEKVARQQNDPSARLEALEASTAQLARDTAKRLEALERPTLSPFRSNIGRRLAALEESAADRVRDRDELREHVARLVDRVGELEEAADFETFRERIAALERERQEIAGKLEALEQSATAEQLARDVAMESLDSRVRQLEKAAAHVADFGGVAAGLRQRVDALERKTAPADRYAAAEVAAKETANAGRIRRLLLAVRMLAENSQHDALEELRQLEQELSR